MARYLVAFLPGEAVPTRIKYIDDATDAPDANDDNATLGVTVGSIWMDTTNKRHYICESAATGLAVWTELTGGSSGGTLNTDLSVSGSHDIDYADGETHDLTLTGNATFTLSGAVTGNATDIRVILRQDGTGSRTVTWPGSVTWAGGSAPTLQTAAAAVDTIGLLTVDDGTTWFGYFDLTGTSLTPASTVEDETTLGITPAVGSSSDYAKGDHTHGSPSKDTIKGAGRWEPVQYDDGSSPWPFVYYNDEIVVAWVET